MHTGILQLVILITLESSNQNFLKVSENNSSSGEGDNPEDNFSAMEESEAQSVMDDTAEVGKIVLGETLMNS